MDIYISKSSEADPTQFANDIIFSQTTFARFNTRDFAFLNTDQGYSVTLYSASSDEGANTFLDNTLTVRYSEYWMAEDVA